jgi:hypothetical protein
LHLLVQVLVRQGLLHLHQLHVLLLLVHVHVLLLE